LVTGEKTSKNGNKKVEGKTRETIGKHWNSLSAKSVRHISEDNIFGFFFNESLLFLFL